MKRILIAGGGLAGSVLAYKARSRGLEVHRIFDPQVPSASAVAYGMLNPVHIRNVVPSWKAAEFFPVAAGFYRSLGEVSGSDFYRETPVYHVLSGDDEAVLWRQNAESTSLVSFSSGDQVHYPSEALIQEYGCVKVDHAFFVDVPAMLAAIDVSLHDAIHISENLRYEEIQMQDGRWAYRGEVYDGIFFCEGSYVASNPYFKALPFRPCKGDVLTIHAPGLNIRDVVHHKIFLIPVGDDYYRAGSTYDWDDLSFRPSVSGRQTIEAALKKLIRTPYEITSHKAGVRPAIADRRPVAGEHPLHKGLFILNGLGSRGLIHVPLVADQLLDYFTEGKELMTELSVARFKKRLGQGVVY